ncbi:uncharacterized protein LOC100198750 [Hydra vulgaris]|uniref:uncharacterized protein LOC100198750 n=1 Tax=Hydra vulgaris TaxID=6087 RepID=UPI0006415E0A|nr:uncharacterized protein LOC100198750 [Hydra vulgaris]XP_047124102.1 uncharacterized protein LOC100198750 [Hydra vulgaris]
MRWLFCFVFVVEWSVGRCSTGECPFFPNAPQRDKSCYETPNCNIDSQCKNNEKCCENPCGITQCFSVDSKKDLEKCPLQNPSSLKCQDVRTKFCYIKSCTRCCYHQKSCNPAPALLTEPSNCHKEICANYQCLQQGSQCFVDEATNKPQCKCNEHCNNTRSYVCGKDSSKSVTYINLCHLDKEACQKEIKISVENQGRCKVQQTLDIQLRPPSVKSKFIRADLSENILVYCYGDHKVVHLSWVQIRQDVEILMTDIFVLNFGVYLIDGKERRVSGLQLKQITSSMYAKYACIQTFNNTQLRDEVIILPKHQEAFDKRMCALELNSGLNINEEYFPNYFYNTTSGICNLFYYTGFEGNENNFQTLEECQTKCQGKKPTFQQELVHEGEKCGTEVCDFYSKCEQTSHSNKCICPNQCSLKKNLVCASDGKTYVNICMMQFYACRWRKPLVPLYAGKCDEAISELEMSSLQDKTLCDLKNCPPSAKCIINTLTKAPQCYCENVCTFNVDIICASDNRQYLNKCFMDAQSCKTKKALSVRNYGLCNILGKNR